jgi:hypothetical protein
VSVCPTCGRYAPPDPETGYDGDDYCSRECAERGEVIDVATVSRKVHVFILDPRAIQGVTLTVKNEKGEDVAAMGSPIQPFRPMPGDRLTIVFQAPK